MASNAIIAACRRGLLADLGWDMTEPPVEYPLGPVDKANVLHIEDADALVDLEAKR